VAIQFKCMVDWEHTQTKSANAVGRDWQEKSTVFLKLTAQS